LEVAGGPAKLPGEYFRVSSSRASRTEWWLSLPVLTAAYLAAVWIGFGLLVQPENFAAFWPAAGFALGVLLLVPTRRWASLLVAWFLAHALSEMIAGFAIIPAISFPTIGLAEVTIGAALIRRTGMREPRAPFDRRALLTMVGWMALVAAPLSATAAAAVQVAALDVGFLNAWVLWWSAELLGELVVAPAVLLLPSLVAWWRSAAPERRLEGLAIVMAIALVTIAIFAMPIGYGALAIAALALPYPMLVITGWRIGPGGVALATAALSFVVVWQSGHQLGPFSAIEQDPVRRLLLIQAYLVIVVGPSLLLAIVEREASEAALQLREIFDHSSEAIFLVDARDRTRFRYESLNRPCELATGLASATVRGRTPHELLPSAVADQSVANYLKCLDAGHAITYEQTLTLAGATRTWLTMLVPIRDGSGAIRRIAGFSRDLTEHRQQETARAALEAQLRQAQKMEAIGRLAGGLAHDFNNILTAIIGHGELLAESAPPRSAQRESADAVLEAGRRASALVRQVLTFARRQEQPRRPTELHAVLTEVMRLARAMVPSTIDVRLSVDTRAPRVMADPTQIHQALMNLISNAAYAMRDRGGVLTVSLDTSVVDREFARSHAPLEAGLAVCLTVSDTGEGMDADTLEHIYEPFFTTKPVGEGTGLGLPVVMGIVQNHDGGLTIDSRPGDGTTVRIFLPAAAEAPAAPPLETASATPRGQGQRVLLVDDEAAVAGIGGRLLESLGYTVTVFTQPELALETFVQDPSAVDLLLTDLTMPVMTGTVLAREMRRHRPDLRVVVATGVPSAIGSAESDQLTVLAKPYTRHTLGLAVAGVLAPIA